MANRLDFEFVGTSSTKLSLDPDEYKGASIPKVEGEILRLLQDISPGVNFFNDDIALAAVALTDGSAADK